MNNNVIVLLFALHATVFCYIQAPSIQSRRAWNAEEPIRKQKTFNGIPTSVVLYHSATSSCNSSTICKNATRNLQNYDINRKKLSDIRYNFLVGEDGNVYEGRGWNFQTIDLREYDSTSLEICIIGIYEYREPNSLAQDALKQLLQYGIENEKISSNYTLYVNRFATSMSRPANQLRNLYRKWPHWKDSWKVIPNSEWKRTNKREREFHTGVPSSVIVFNSPKSNCITEAACKEAVKKLDLLDSESDYNFLIGEDGNVYESCGWNYIGKHLDNIDLINIEILLMGNFTEKEPLPSAIDAIGNLLEYGIMINRLLANFTLYDRPRPIKTLDAPDKLHDLISEWPFAAPSPNIYAITVWSSYRHHLKMHEYMRNENSVFVVQTNTPGCSTTSDCIDSIRNMYKTNEWDAMRNEIRCHFLIGEDGNVYEDYGWIQPRRSGASAINLEIPMICMIGNFTNRAPDSAATYALDRFLEFGVALGKISATYHLYTANITNGSIVNGMKLNELLKKSPHWKGSSNIIGKLKWYGYSTLREYRQWQTDKWFILFNTKNISTVILSYHDRPSCATVEECTNLFRKSENIIGNSNFLIGQDSNVYEAIGWAFNQEHRDSIVVALFGNFTDGPRNCIAIEALRNFLKSAVAEGRLKSNFILYDRNEKMGQGRNWIGKFRDALKEFPHWREIPTIVKRLEWNGGNVEASIIEKPYRPATRVAIYQFVNQSCASLDTCKPTIKYLQNIYLKTTYKDVPCHFMIDESGNIYEGYGWRNVIHSKTEYLEIMFKICIIGKFEDASRFPTVFDSMNHLFDYAIATGVLKKNYILNEYRHANASPVMLHLYESIKKLPHWQASPTIIERLEWNGTHKYPGPYLRRSASQVVIYQFYNNRCTSIDSCKETIKYLQNSYSATPVKDVPYHFFIDESGNIYEGVGWLNDVYKSNDYRRIFTRICIIGKFQDNGSFPRIFNALQNLLDYAIRIFNLADDYILYGLRHPNSHPDMLDMYESVKKLPHWEAHPNIFTRYGWATNDHPVYREISSDYSSLVIISYIPKPIATVSVGPIPDVQEVAATSVISSTPIPFDIGQNFIIEDNGNVYEELGWNVKGKYSTAYNKSIIEIGVMYDSYEKGLNPKTMDAIRNLIEYGIKMGKIISSYTLYSFRPTSDGVGQKLSNAIESSPHWQAMPVYANRSAWGSKQPKNTGTEYSKRPSVVRVSYLETLKCDTTNHCKRIVQHIQDGTSDRPPPISPSLLKSPPRVKRHGRRASYAHKSRDGERGTAFMALHVLTYRPSLPTHRLRARNDPPPPCPATYA